MLYEKSALVGYVRIAMEENVDGGTLVSSEWDDDALCLEELIPAKILDAAQMLLSRAPNNYLGSGSELPVADLTWHDAVGVGSGEFTLPADYLRLLVFRMSDWECAVYHAIGEEDVAYALQSSRYGGLRGNPQRPVVAVVNRGGSRVLEFYSCVGGDGVTVKEHRYVSIPAWKSVDGIDKLEFPELMLRQLVNQAGAFTAGVLGEQALQGALQGQVGM